MMRRIEIKLDENMNQVIYYLGLQVGLIEGSEMGDACAQELCAALKELEEITE